MKVLSLIAILFALKANADLANLISGSTWQTACLESKALTYGEDIKNAGPYYRRILSILDVAGDSLVGGNYQVDLAFYADANCEEPLILFQLLDHAGQFQIYTDAANRTLVKTIAEQCGKTGRHYQETLTLTDEAMEVENISDKVFTSFQKTQPLNSHGAKRPCR